MKAAKARTLVSIGFGAVAISSAIAVLAIAYTQLQRIQATATRITGDTLPSIYLSGQLQSSVLHRYALLTDYENADEAKKAALEHQIESASARIDDILHAYEALIDSPVDRRLFENIRSARVPYAETYDRAFENIRESRAA